MNRAVFSPDRVYRYWLERDVAPLGSTFVYFGVNGSTADETQEDPTSRKWIGFTRRHGGRRYIAVNPFAYTATEVRDLANPKIDPVGPDNDKFLGEAIAEADVLVPCWGSRDKLPERLRYRLSDLLLAILLAGRITGVPVMTFGFTAGGDPKHPLMLGYDTPLLHWDVAKLI